MKNVLLLTGILMLMMSSCSEKSKKDQAILIDDGDIVNYIESPSTSRSLMPNLFSNKNKTLLTWTEQEKKAEEKKLYYAELINGKWTSPNHIVTENTMLVNWADFPAIAENNGYLLSHNLNLIEADNFAYDIKLNFFNPHESKWITDIALNTDGTSEEHGFVTMLPYKENSFFVTWLDGRNMKSHEKRSDGSIGKMTIRAAEINSKGEVVNDVELDNNTCHCCQTSAAMTNNGPIVVFRDRSDEEIRDISIVRLVDGQWTAPKTVFDDGWKIMGCPVNGPSADAIANNLAVVWFGVANSVNPEVKVAFSDNGGEGFDAPILISNTDLVGRVDVAMIDGDSAIVSWMESNEEGGQLKAVKVNRSGEKSEPVLISSLDASRAGGFPQMEIVDDKMYIVWSALVNDKATTMTAWVSLKDM